MKRSDIDTLQADGMISEQQHAAIVSRYALDTHGARIGGIFAMIGAALCMAGVALVISANWPEIPRLVKIAAAVLLLVALHAGGVYAKARTYPRISAALHVAGSVMFLLSIALIGQAYNLSSRPPNAILLWTLGIAALPWLLGSRAQFLLLIGACVTWLAMESDAVDSWLYVRDFGFFAPVIWSWIGALLLAVAIGLRVASASSRAFQFDRSVETVAVVMLGVAMLICVMGYNEFGVGTAGKSLASWASRPALWISALSLCVVAASVLVDRAASIAARAAWVAAVTAAIAWPWWMVLSKYSAADTERWERAGPMTWFASAILFVFALAQIQRGVTQASRLMVSIGIAFVALNIVVVYFRLFGSMMHTGVTFVVTGALLVVLAWFLERWRRRLTAQMVAAKTQPGAHHE